jgi:hypothetical protein
MFWVPNHLLWPNWTEEKSCRGESTSGLLSSSDRRRQCRLDLFCPELAVCSIGGRQSENLEDMDRGELGKTTASVSNDRVYIDYYIGL